jgi:hypothetical protein
MSVNVYWKTWAKGDETDNMLPQRTVKILIEIPGDDLG